MNFSLYSYKYSCPRWYGNVEGINNIYVNKNKPIKYIHKMAIKEANKLSGSKTCNINLLNKFEVAIKSVETYPSLTGIDLNKISEKNFNYKKENN